MNRYVIVPLSGEHRSVLFAREDDDTAKSAFRFAMASYASYKHYLETALAMIEDLRKLAGNIGSHPGLPPTPHSMSEMLVSYMGNLLGMVKAQGRAVILPEEFIAKSAGGHPVVLGEGNHGKHVDSVDGWALYKIDDSVVFSYGDPDKAVAERLHREWQNAIVQAELHLEVAKKMLGVGQ